MNSITRVRNYARQHGFPEGAVFPDTYGKLTPAQQRRVRRKENRSTRRAGHGEEVTPDGQ